MILTREEQELVNTTRRQGTSSQNVRRHNSNINRLITFVNEKFQWIIQWSSVPNEIPGPIDHGTVLPPSTVLPLQSIIKSIDLDNVRVKRVILPMHT